MGRGAMRRAGCPAGKDMRLIRPGSALWRWLAALTLVLVTAVGLVGPGVPRAAAATTITVTLTDPDGVPLSGAAFAVFDAVESEDGSGALVSGDVLVAGPVETDGDGLAVFAPLPDATSFVMVQTAAPPGYDLAAAEQVFSTADTAGEDGEAATDEVVAQVDLAFVNALAPPVFGTLDVSVVDGVSGVPLVGAEVVVYERDPATGGRGVAVAFPVSGNDGYATVELPAGEYRVGLAATPGGYTLPGPAEDRLVALAEPVDGVGDYQVATVSVAPVDVPVEVPTPAEPPVPTEPPVPPPAPEPTATDAPPPTDPPATEAPATVAPATEAPATAPPVTEVPATTPPVPPVTDPPATDPPLETPPTAESPTDPAPTDVPPAEPPTAEPPTAEPAEPGMVLVGKAICVDGVEAGTARLEVGLTLEDFTAAGMPVGCRIATAGEATFTVRDPVAPEVDFDEVDLTTAETDDAGLARLAVPMAGESRRVYVREDNTGYRSGYFDVAPGGAVQVLVVNLVVPPTGELTVAAVDAVSQAPLPGACFALTAGGVALDTVCDGEDGTTDGRVAFGERDNGRYEVTPVETPGSYVPAAPVVVEVGGESQEVAAAAVPYGSVEALAFACPAVASGVTFAVETPGVTVVDDGTGGAGGVAAPELVAGCAPAGADLVLYPYGDTSAAPIALQAAPGGAALPVAVPPTDDETGPHLLRDRTTGAEATVAVAPATRTTVTVVVGADALPEAGSGTDAAAGDPLPAGDGAVPVPTPPLPPPSPTATPETTAADRAETLSVTTLPRTGSGAPAFDTGGGHRWALLAVLALVAVASVGRALRLPAPVVSPPAAAPRGRWPGFGGETGASARRDRW